MLGLISWFKSPPVKHGYSYKPHLLTFLKLDKMPKLTYLLLLYSNTSAVYMYQILDNVDKF